MVTFVLSEEQLFEVRSNCFSAELLFVGIVFRNIYDLRGRHGLLM